jgi:CRP/FNR family cyclic AMP-dependent transcriptional regulator
MGGDYRSDLLSKHYLFGTLRLEQIEEIVALAKEKTFGRSTRIFDKGDPGSSMMVVLRGRVRICSFGIDGQELVFNIMERGDVFGELTLMDGRDRSASAVAMDDSALLVLERADFLPFLERSPQVAIRLVEVLCGHVRRISDSVEGLAFLQLPGRLARLLLRLAQSHGKRSESGVQIELRLSQSDLGALVAGSRESVNRLLRLWQDQGLLTVQGRRITIRDTALMAEYAAG